MNTTSQATTFDESSAAWPRSAETVPTTEASEFDYRLAQRIAGGDMQAFEELYQRYYRRVYSLCLRMTNHKAEAEDLTQEIFIHVYRKIGGFRGESTMRTWLYRVTVNKVLMHFRKNSTRREQTTEDGELPEPVVKVTKTKGQTPLLDRLALEHAIAQLAPGYRAVFILHDVEGYEHAEIAQICGNSIGTSKSQLHKARKKLYELLREPN
jgi:RNA polymerase sigma-70 factor (ECF subfamily)